MLTAEAANRLDVVGPIPIKIEDPSFAETGNLWKKEKHHLHFNLEAFQKKYAYTKIGKTLGLQTTRYLCVHSSLLLYFDEAISKDYLGYCCLENIYIEWFELKTGKYLLLLSNGQDTSLFYFDSPVFWLQQRQRLTINAIQLDFNQKYEILQQLGEGSFSKVYLAQCKSSGEKVAAKMIYKLDKHKNPTKKLISQQRHILNELQNSNYTYRFKQLYEVSHQYIFILEFLPGKDLMTIFKDKLQVPLPKLKILFTNILYGLKDCHSSNIIHRDIKPQNIIVDDSLQEIKIIDFGLSLNVSKNMEIKHYRRCGTMGYMSPEVFANRRDQMKPYGFKSDLFSFGIIAHMLLLGFNPLKGRNYEQTLAKNKQCKIELNQKQIVSQYGEGCLVFLKCLLNTNPKLRYTAQQALNSHFLRENTDKQQSTSTMEEGKRLGYEE